MNPSINSIGSRAAVSINGIIDWFIPESIGRDREMRKQCRLFLISHLFGPFLGNTVPLSLYLLDPHPGFQVYVLAISITGFWAFPPILRAVGHYNLLALVSIQNLIFCILWSCYYYGGVTSPTLPWVLTIPLLAFFYIGSSPSLRLTVLAMFAANLVIFALAYNSGYQPHTNLPLSALQGLGIVSTIAASLYVTMMALFYARALASHAELESEVRQHHATALQLRSATEEAELAGSAKSDFLAKMSHELRTPLNAVIGYSQMLLEDAHVEGDEQNIADLNKIHGSGQHLLKIVNEILDLSKIDAGKMELYHQEIDIEGLLSDPLQQIAAAVQAQGNILSVAVASDIGPLVCDIVKVQQVLGQILDNANKFTKNGKIDVIVTCEASSDGNNLVIAVKDTGVGMAPEQLPTLFQHFTVLDDATTSKYGGTGLGLALSRRLCLLMNGTITVSSAAGVGSVLTITLPVMPRPMKQTEDLRFSIAA